MNNPEQITIVSMLVAGITAVWAYFTKREAEQQKQEKEAAKAREAQLNESIAKKDEMIVNLARESIKTTVEVKSSVDNNTAALRDTHNVTKQVLDELIRIKLLNGGIH